MAAPLCTCGCLLAELASVPHLVRATRFLFLFCATAQATVLYLPPGVPPSQTMKKIVDWIDPEQIKPRVAGQAPPSAPPAQKKAPGPLDRVSQSNLGVVSHPTPSGLQRY